MTSSFAEANASFPFDSCNLLLGKGGSGAVFLARHHDTRQLAAVKRCYTRKSDHDLHPSPPTFPRSPTAAFPEVGSFGRASSRSSPTHRDSDPSSASVFINEVEMREESNLETVALSQHPHHDATAVIAPSASSPSSTSPGSPNSPGHMDEATVLEFLGKHPHVVDYLGSYTSSRRVKFFAMELMDSDVGRELRSSNPFICTEEACLVLGFHTLGALEHIHACGVTHRDVKPCNIFLKRVTSKEASQAVLVSGAVANAQALPGGGGRMDTYVKAHLGDFSAAHLLGTSTTVSPTLATRGTLFYKAPEQLLGRPIADFAALDMWALGCTLVEVITGCVAFPGSSELQVLLQQLHSLGSNFAEYPIQTGAVTLFASFGTTPQSLRLADLLTHLLALDPEKRFTARQALDHPFFAVLRQRQQHLAQQLRTTHSEADTVGDVPVYLKARLLSTRCPEAAQLRVSFRPVALTPYHKRQRAERERAERPRFAPDAQQDGFFLSCPRVSTGLESGCVSDRPAQSSHRSEPEAKTVLCETEKQDAHPPLHLGTPYEGNSFVSDGPSIHWSQMRSFVGANGDGSSFLEYQRRASEEKQGSSQRPSLGKEGGSRGGSLLLPSPHASGAPVPPFSMPHVLSSSPGGGVMVPLVAPACGATDATAVTRWNGPTGTGGRPVLIAASGTAFTASNLRACHDFESCMGRGSERLSGGGDGTASFRALTYSSDERVRSPTSLAATQTGSTSFERSSSERDRGSGAAPRLGSAALPSAPARARKMLLFESPNPHRQLPPQAFLTPRPADATTPRGAVGDGESAQKRTSRLNSSDLQNQTVEGSDGVDASVILGFESRSSHSDGIRSCCSSATATPLNFLRSEYAPPVHTLRQASQQQRGSFFSSAAPPLSISFMEAVTADGEGSASTPEAVTARTRRPPTATPTIAALRGPVRKPTASGSSGASSSPKAVLRERSLNASHESIRSALCSPVPRRVPSGPGNAPLPHRLRQALPVGRRYPAPLPLQPLPHRPRALTHRDPFGNGHVEETVAEPHRSPSLPMEDAAPVDQTPRGQYFDPRLIAAAAHHFNQQRHCTPSSEPVAEGTASAVVDPHEEERTGPRLDDLCHTVSPTNSMSDESEESVKNGSGTKKRTKYETPVA